MQREENKVIMDDIKARMAKAKEAAEEYERACGDEELWNVADLIVDNKLLIDKFDQIMGRPAANEALDVTTESELGEISNSIIDQLYAQYQQYGPAKRSKSKKGASKYGKAKPTQTKPKAEAPPAIKPVEKKGKPSVK